MKATLEFTLPEEERDLALALRAGKLQSALYHTSESIRARLKYSEGLSDEERAWLTDLRAEISAELPDE